jgi:hypothetical protein
MLYSSKIKQLCPFLPFIQKKLIMRVDKEGDFGVLEKIQ